MKITMTMTPSPGPVGTIVVWPKAVVFADVGGTTYQKRRSIVVAVSGGEATMESWSRPSRGWRKHVRNAKARRTP